MLQKNCVIPPKTEKVEMGNRDIKNRKVDVVLVWAEYIVVCHKIVVHFSSQKHFVYILEFRTNAFIQIWQTSGKR